MLQAPVSTAVVRSAHGHDAPPALVAGDGVGSMRTGETRSVERAGARGSNPATAT
jgi:hypothetical protein